MHVTFQFGVLSLSLCGILTAEDTGGTVHVDFESVAEGPYTDGMVKQQWKNIAWSGLKGRAHIVTDVDKDRGRVLKLSYPKGAVGPGEGGGQFLVRLLPAREYWLSYWVKFGNGFDFNRGGKLPGLTSGGGRYTGGRKPVDGDGWSARYMWRQGGSPVVYFYHVDMPGRYGQDLSLGEGFTPGKWHRLTQHIKVNNVGKKDGLLGVWFDDLKVISRSDIRYRLAEKGLADSFYFSTFHGGSSKDWAPNVDCYAYFDDFLISHTPPPFKLPAKVAKKSAEVEYNTGFELGVGRPLSWHLGRLGPDKESDTEWRDSGYRSKKCIALIGKGDNVNLIAECRRPFPVSGAGKLTISAFYQADEDTKAKMSLTSRNENGKQTKFDWSPTYAPTPEWNKAVWSLQLKPDAKSFVLKLRNSGRGTVLWDEVNIEFE